MKKLVLRFSDLKKGFSPVVISSNVGVKWVPRGYLIEEHECTKKVAYECYKKKDLTKIYEIREDFYKYNKRVVRNTNDFN